MFRTIKMRFENHQVMKILTGLLLINVATTYSLRVRAEQFLQEKNDYMKKILGEHFTDEYFKILYDSMHPNLLKLEYARSELSNDFQTRQMHA